LHFYGEIIMKDRKKTDEVLIGYWTEDLFEIALWKTKRRGAQQLSGKFSVFIQKSELNNHYLDCNLEDWKL
jgi:hypothetical protein